MGVAFLASSLLAGLFVAALPLVIHLISKRRARRVRFGAIEFVLRSQKRTTRSLRLRQLLLLAVRTLLLVLIALAVARPVFREAPRLASGDAPLAVVFALDESGSMHAALDGESAFDRGRKKAEDLVRALPEDVKLALITCGEPIRDVMPEPGFDRGALLAALGELEAGYGRSDLSACVARGVELLARVDGKGERRVVVLSDLAAHALPAGARQEAPRGLAIEWVPAFDEEPPPNHGIVVAEVDRVAAAEGDAVEVRFTAARFGSAAEVPVDLVVDGSRVARLTLPFSEGAQQERSFTHGFASRAGLAPEASIRLGDDALAADNEVALPIDLAPPVRVLIVDGAPQPVPFRDEVFYLESALKQARRSHAHLDIDVIATEQVNPGTLAGARVVVLANVARLDEASARALVQLVTAGGGLLITAGDQLDVDWYNQTLGEVLPGRLRGAKGQALLDDAAVSETLGLTGFLQAHPLFEGIAGVDARSLPGLRRVETHTLMLLEPDATAPREVLMRFTNEAPALVERRVEGGRVLLLATSVDRDWTDLPIRPGYLPLVQQSVLYLAGALDTAGPRFLRVGEALTLTPPRGAESVEVVIPGGTVRRLEVDGGTGAADGATALRFFDTRQPGLYRVFVRFAGGEARELVRERFSVQMDPRESDLTVANQEALADAVPSGAEVRGGAGGDDDLPLWPSLLLGAVVLLLLESWLLRRG